MLNKFSNWGFILDIPIVPDFHLPMLEDGRVCAHVFIIVAINIIEWQSIQRNFKSPCVFRCTVAIKRENPGRKRDSSLAEGREADSHVIIRTCA